MRKIFFKFLEISIFWPFTFYSDPALAYCGKSKNHETCVVSILEVEIGNCPYFSFLTRLKDDALGIKNATMSKNL